jgi:hypothetical protein
MFRQRLMGLNARSHRVDFSHTEQRNSSVFGSFRRDRLASALYHSTIEEDKDASKKKGRLVLREAP